MLWHELTTGPFGANWVREVSLDDWAIRGGSLKDHVWLQWSVDRSVLLELREKSISGSRSLAIPRHQDPVRTSLAWRLLWPPRQDRVLSG